MSNFSDAGRPGGTALAGRAPANTARVMLGSGGGVAGVLHKVPWRAGEDGHCESGRSARSERDAVAGTRGSLPSGGGGTEQARTTSKRIKTPQVMGFFFPPFPVCAAQRLRYRDPPPSAPLLSGAGSGHGGDRCVDSGHGFSAHGDCHHTQSPSTRSWCLWCAPTSGVSPLLAP